MCKLFFSRPVSNKYDNRRKEACKWTLEFKKKSNLSLDWVSEALHQFSSWWYTFLPSGKQMHGLYKTMVLSSCFLLYAAFNHGWNFRGNFLQIIYRIFVSRHLLQVCTIFYEAFEKRITNTNSSYAFILLVLHHFILKPVVDFFYIPSVHSSTATRTIWGFNNFRCFLPTMPHERAKHEKAFCFYLSTAFSQCKKVTLVSSTNKGGEYAIVYAKIYYSSKYWGFQTWLTGFPQEHDCNFIIEQYSTYEIAGLLYSDRQFPLDTIFHLMESICETFM